MNVRTFALFALLQSAATLSASAQLDLGGIVRDKVNQRVNQRANEAVDKAINKAETSATQNDNTQARSPETSTGGSTANGNSSGNTKATTSGASARSQSPKTANGEDPAATFKSFQNYDFVPGDKVLFEDDWHDDEVGEFPAHWKLEDGEFLVNAFQGANALVAKERSGGSRSIPWSLAPRMKTPDYLPKEFTVEMEVYGLPQVPNEGADNRSSHSIAVRLSQSDNSTVGEVWLEFFRGGKAYTSNFPNEFQKEGLESGKAHSLALAYRNNQLKIYLDGARLFSVPDVGGAPARLSLAFMTEDNELSCIIKHIRIAEGGNSNLIKKLTTATKFIARGITFDYGKATLKAESMGEFNRIAAAMKEDATLKFEIGGHTDSDGDDASNLRLSQARADAVKAKLVSMGVAGTRLTTKGYGETTPISDNATPEGKANNRRVEFTKQ